MKEIVVKDDAKNKVQSCNAAEKTHCLLRNVIFIGVKVFWVATATAKKFHFKRDSEYSCGV